MYKMDLPLNNLQYLKCHKTKPNQTIHTHISIYILYVCVCERERERGGKKKERESMYN